MRVRAAVGRICIGLLAPLALASCQSAESSGDPASSATAEQVQLMQVVNSRAQQCWRRDRAFSAYRFVPELDTRVGRPRLLVVHAGAAQGLPQYVIQAEGTPARIVSFGPLAQDPLSRRMNEDVGRWSTGDEQCQAA